MAEDELAGLIDRAAALDPQSDEYWDLVQRLHQRSDRTAFDAVLAAARSPERRRRLVGADVLGQIGYAAGRLFRDETLAALLDLVGGDGDGDGDDQVIAAAVTALGHVADARARPAMLRLAGHAKAKVRLAVAVALPGTTDADAPTGDVVEALIRLSRDADAEVRDWATFGIGSQLVADTPDVRDALADRLDDPDADTADEALLGLATRHDRRALATVLARLDGDPSVLVIDAAAELADPVFLPALSRLRDHGWSSDAAEAASLEAAIGRSAAGLTR